MDAAYSRARRGLAGVTKAPARVLVIAAAVCGVLSLGLKWGSAVSGVYLPGLYVPGLCTSILGADGYYSMECGPDYWSFGMTLPGSDGASGLQTSARVFVVVVVVAAAVALRRRSRQWALAAVIAAAAGLLLSGLSARPGQLAYLAAAILLALALHRAGLLGREAGAQQPAMTDSESRA